MNGNLPVQQQNGNETVVKPKKKITSIIAIVLAIQVILAVFLGVYLYRRGFEKSKNNTAEKIRKDAYNAVYGASEAAHHVSNNVTISVDNIREKAELEVLEITTSYLYLSDQEDESNGYTIWYKIPGNGVFTVDLRMAEFVVDAERQHVLAKVPAPALTQFEEVYDKIEKLKYAEHKFLSNGSVQEGIHIAMKILARAHVDMVKSFEMNQAYHLAAEESASRLITTAIKSMNPSLKQLTVDVEFVNGVGG